MIFHNVFFFSTIIWKMRDATDFIKIGPIINTESIYLFF